MLTRITVRVLLALAAVVVLLAALVTDALFFDVSDLPDVQTMISFAPQAPATIADADICGENVKIVAIPTGQMTELRNALFAAEGDVDPRNIIRRLYDDFSGDRAERNHYGTYSLQLSRQLLCNDHRRALKRQLAEVRTSVQLDRHFTTNQLLDIYLNRVHFGPGVYGVENAAEHYFAKPASQLSTPEAALLMGLIRAPDRFSPLTHPDNALTRRNEVIDAMVKRGSMSSQEADQAKRTPIGTVAGDSGKPPL